VAIVEPKVPPKGWWRRRPALAAFGIGALLVAAAIGGGWYYWAGHDGPGDYVEVFLTDLPADLAALELTVGAVLVGAANHSLHVETPVFDLLQLQGLSQSIRVASGFVPAGADRSTVGIVFDRAVATIAGQEVALPIPEAMLLIEHGRSELSSASSAILLDIDVENSVPLVGDGYVFKPWVTAVYVYEYEDKPGRATDGGPDTDFRATHTPAFDEDEPTTPKKQDTVTPPSDTPRGGSGSGGSTSGSGTTGTDNVAPDLGGATGGGSGDGINDTGDLVQEELGIIVQYTNGQGQVVAAHLTNLGLTVLHTYTSDDALYLLAPLSAVRDIAEIPQVTYIEKEKPISFTLDTSKDAIDAEGIAHLVTGLKDSQGNPIDGRGVGVAVIDTGIDATHPDLPYNDGIHPDPVIMQNLKVGSVSYLVNLVPMVNTDSTSGHGTHVAGIVAGQGSVDAAHKGVAPGARLYGLGVGEMSTTLWTNQALDWVRLNHDQVDPPIRVVTNSWTTGTTYDPNAYSSKVVRDLVDAGVVVVFSAGNDGGDGSSIRTSGEAQNPREGVISVGSYDDHDDGRQNGGLASSSSRGKTLVASSWPDVSAPGVTISSTKAAISAGGLGVLTAYKELSGTSQAAPHVAGVVALILQANPDLTPAQVEAILEGTAYAFGIGYAKSADDRYDGSHYAKGHGLVDAWEAVEAAKAW
jgi:serine protease AprX